MSVDIFHSVNRDCFMHIDYEKILLNAEII